MTAVDKYLNNQTIILEEVYLLAIVSLQGITDKAGKPMSEHAIEIAQNFWKEGDWYKAVIASLHDVIEDSETITDGKELFNRLEQIKFGTVDVDAVKDILISKGHEPENFGMSVGDVVEAVELLTRKKGVTYFDYIRTIKESKNKDAIGVKIADIEHHLDNSAWIPNSLVGRYEKALDILKGK